MGRIVGRRATSEPVEQAATVAMRASHQDSTRALALNYYMADHSHLSVRIALDVVPARRQVDDNVDGCTCLLEQRRGLR
jgi:hypothetical protein